MARLTGKYSGIVETPEEWDIRDSSFPEMQLYDLYLAGGKSGVLKMIRENGIVHINNAVTHYRVIGSFEDAEISLTSKLAREHPRLNYHFHKQDHTSYSL
jgi:hypothetical protein